MFADFEQDSAQVDETRTIQLKFFDGSPPDGGYSQD
jgi:hypothetical protein